MKTSSEAVPPNARCLNQSIEAATESSPIQAVCSLEINRECVSGRISGTSRRRQYGSSPDSLLEETGFEPSVPSLTVPLGP